MSESEVLFGLRERVASLQVLPCRLAHEQVVLEHGFAKRRSRGIGIEPALVRTGLCPSGFRSRQLSCAHTTARYVLERAIDALEKKAVLSVDEAGRLRADLHRISNSIHQADWSKGEAEARYALLMEQGTMTETPVSASLLAEQQRLTELGNHHHDAVQELRCLHSQLLGYLDSVLAGLGG
ncbi:MAG TPA: hypothetical protein VM571_05010 [Noviherbaspirillum sp.]|nr:hypothetical protein [Noviherbaspirillum sp.]